MKALMKHADTRLTILCPGLTLADVQLISTLVKISETDNSPKKTTGNQRLSSVIFVGDC
jgi:hypothetical protein